MRVHDIAMREFLGMQDIGGVIRIMRQRMLLFDAVTLGLLRKELIEVIGPLAARGVLTRFGYAHGWRTAEVLHTEFPLLFAEADAGAHLHMLFGLVLSDGFKRTDEKGGSLHIESTWINSYEAEQHLLHIGKSDTPICWTLTGFASGFESYRTGREVYFIEDRCCGQGDEVCHIAGRYREDWGPELDPYILFYKMSDFDSILRQLTDKLHATEKKLKKAHQKLAVHAVYQVKASSFIVRSKAMQVVIDLARRTAQVESSVVVMGESGVGKEVISRYIHENSSRAHGPFVAVNCGALTEQLLESELFGHARGSFTGADRDRAGLFEAAQNGTLFLDEISEISPRMQVKLLRAIQEKEVRRVGENKSRQVNARIITATNVNLAEAVVQGRFRQDLYYRLRVIELHVPPLRERSDDTLPLAFFFLDKLSREMGKDITGFSARAVQLLLSYNWPGNVRELQNGVERAVALTLGPVIGQDDLPLDMTCVVSNPVLASDIRPLVEIERDYILAAIKAAEGDKDQAAAKLGIGRSTLYRKLLEYDGRPSWQGMGPTT